MAVNFEKVLALTAKIPAGTTAFQLGDVQLATISQIITEKNLIDDFGNGISPSEIAQGSLTYLKNVAGTLTDKAAIGGGTINNAKIGSVTIG